MPHSRFAGTGGVEESRRGVSAGREEEPALLAEDQAQPRLPVHVERQPRARRAQRQDALALRATSWDVLAAGGAARAEEGAEQGGCVEVGEQLGHRFREVRVEVEHILGLALQLEGSRVGGGGGR